MKARLNPYQAAPEAMKAMIALENHIRASGLDPTLAELVKIRASQINGCAYCLNMHTGEATAKGETAERIFLLDAWRESPLYSPRERAALAWTEAVTLVANSRVPDEVFEEARAQFGEEELVKLTLLINAINAWNRFGVAFRSVHPVKQAAHAA